MFRLSVHSHQTYLTPLPRKFSIEKHKIAFCFYENVLVFKLVFFYLFLLIAEANTIIKLFSDGIEILFRCFSSPPKVVLKSFKS